MPMILRANSTVSEQSLPESRAPLSGSFEQIREDVRRLAALGYGHVFFDLVAMPVHEQLRVLAKLRRVADE